MTPRHSMQRIQLLNSCIPSRLLNQRFDHHHSEWVQFCDRHPTIPVWAWQLLKGIHTVDGNKQFVAMLLAVCLHINESGSDKHIQGLIDGKTIVFEGALLELPNRSFSSKIGSCSFMRQTTTAALPSPEATPPFCSGFLFVLNHPVNHPVLNIFDQKKLRFIDHPSNKHIKLCQR